MIESIRNGTLIVLLCHYQLIYEGIGERQSIRRFISV